MKALSSLLPLVASISLLSLPVARADVAATRCQGPESGPVRAVLHGTACAGFTTVRSGRTAEVRFPRQASGDLLASRDGRTVVMIESYLPGRVKDATTVESYYGNETQLDPTVMSVYRDGKLVAFYDLLHLVKDLRKVEQSISHIRWVAELPASLDGDNFTLVTTSGWRLVFDVETGALVRSEHRPARPRRK